jgi:L-fuconolactonase
MIIDAHQHFWHLSRPDYAWLTPQNAVLYRNYQPADLAPVLLENGVGATVLIQAAASESETRYLFQLARENSFIAGVVGWLDFEAAEAPGRLAMLLADGHGKLKGLRPMIQDIAGLDWIVKPALDAAFEAMIAHDLAFDALVRPAHLDALRLRLLRHPKLRAVLDHAGKPDIARGGFDAWAEKLARLASETAVYCKLSGLLTETRSGAAAEDLAPYIEHIFSCFGPLRMLWGSDWPVLNTAGDYAHWLTQSRSFVRRFAEGHERDVFHDNAIRFYQLELP